MNSLAPYPWQHTAWQFLHEQRQQHKLPHALLINGQEGMGKTHFARLAAQLMLCQTPVSELPCGQCRACQLCDAASHPDLLVIEPEAAYKTIKVDQIRQVAKFMSTTAQQGGFKVVILGPAEQLNINAANAILKNLEEPANDTLLLLITHVLTQVMPTIRSRCQILSLPTPEHAQTSAWLQGLGLGENVNALLDLSANAPLRAKALAAADTLDKLNVFLTMLIKSHQCAGDITLVKSCLDIELHELLEWWLQLLILSCTRQVANGPPHNGGDLSQHLSTLRQQMHNVHPQWVYRFIDKLLLLKRQLLAGANPNKHLLLEELLLDWGALLAKPAPSS
ncbi:MAG: DNA polymerase III subunit delta' [Cellvibrionaceae bacterium]|nr:DNA polymerase III subunit delta' [Cellvibrionaceae bacterium]